MIQRIRGNGIPSWPEALRRAALPALGGPVAALNPALSAPARVWRACKSEDSAHGTGSASLSAGCFSDRRPDGTMSAVRYHCNNTLNCAGRAPDTTDNPGETE